jgi:site-specific recombinase XerC
MIANGYTRVCHDRAVRAFLSWPAIQGKALHEISPGHVGDFFLEMPGSVSKKKQHMAGLRSSFNLLVERQICWVNPAAVATTKRLVVVEGKTPQITAKQASQLVRSIDTSNYVGQQDRAIIGILMWTGVRAGSISKLQRGNFYPSGEQRMLRFDEKRRRFREIPVRNDRLLLSVSISLRPTWNAPKQLPWK